MMNNQIIENQFRLLIHTLLKSNKIFNPRYPCIFTPSTSVSSSSSSCTRSNQNTTTIKAIINILNCRGVLVYILTSNHALHHIYNLPSLSLVHFISAIIEIEVIPSIAVSGDNDNNNNRKNNHANKCNTIQRENENLTNSISSTTSRKRRKKETHHPYGCFSRKSNHIPSLLHFLKQVLMRRWCMNDIQIGIQKVHERQQEENRMINIKDIINSGHNKRRKQCIFNLWIIHFENYQERTIEQEPSSSGGELKNSSVVSNNDQDKKDTTTTERNLENIFPILDARSQNQNQVHQYYRWKSTDEDWVICITFLLAYRSLFHQVGQIMTTLCYDESNNGNNEIDFVHTEPVTNRLDATTKRALIMSKDEVITKSLHVLLLLFIKSTNDVKMNICTANPQQPILISCFPKHWVKLISFIKDVNDTLSKHGLEKEKKGSYEALNVFSCGGNESSDDKDQQDHVFDKLWSEMLMTTKRQNKEDDTGNDKNNELDLLDTIDKLGHTLHSHELNNSNEEAQDNDKDESTIMLEETTFTDSTVVIPEKKGILDKDLENMVMNLRSEFFTMGQNPTSNVINDVSRKTVDLLQKAGKDNGAIGIKEVAMLLKYGETKSQPFDHYNKQGSTENQKKGDKAATQPVPNEENDQSVYHFPDVFVSNLCKACINQETSAVRASMIMSEFVLPSIVQLKLLKCRAASRSLMSTLSFLANDRPAECASSLLVPSLCYSFNGGGGKEREDDIHRSAPNKAQCELVCKIVKQAKLPKEVLGSIVADLTIHMVWNEQTVPVLTTCLQKKPQLSGEAIDLLVKRICRSINGHEGSTDMDVHENESIQNIRKGMKFSTLFHTFVTKHGTQIQNDAVVKDLLSAASLLKTILGKSICTSLKKL